MYESGARIYLYSRTETPRGRGDWLELMSYKYGVRRVNSFISDREDIENDRVPAIYVQLTSRQYHRKRWKILQKGKR